jgi:hypothetical protein
VRRCRVLEGESNYGIALVSSRTLITFTFT